MTPPSSVTLPDQVESVQAALLTRSSGTALKEVLEAVYPHYRLGSVPFPALRRAFDTYFRWNQTLDERGHLRLFGQGQIAWSGTMIAKCQRKYLASWLDAAGPQIRNELASVRMPTDFGAGDGQMTCRLLESLASIGASPTQVILIDQNSEALILATRRLRRHFGPALEIESKCGRFQRMQFPTANPEFRLVFASSALHELPRAQKQQVLNKVAISARFLLVVELSSDHEAPASGSSTLAWRAARFYDALLADAFESLPATVHQSVVGVFLLDGLLDLWFENYDNRHNYHLSAAGWTECLTQAGYEVTSIEQFDTGTLETCYILAESPGCRCSTNRTS